MILDHYATLGVAPHADRATIRTAYVQLMRRYHPDRNPSPLAAARVRAVTAAYSVLGVADRRARYDLERPRARAAQRRASAMVPHQSRFDQYLWMVVGIAAVAMVVAIMVPQLPIATDVPDRGPPVGSSETAANRETVPAARGSAPDAPCSASVPADLIKRELFARAARLRGRDHSALEKLGAASFLRVSAPPRAGPSTGAPRCTAAIVVHLPPGVEASGGRQWLSGQVGYSPRPDGERATPAIGAMSDGLVELLATVARASRRVSDTVTPVPVPVPAIPGEPPALLEPPHPTVAPARALPATALPAATLPSRTLPARAGGLPPASPQSPSFSCRSAGSWAATTVCNSASLSALDRGLASLYGDSMARAEASKRTSLIESDRRFLARRDACRSEACVRGAYLMRIQAINTMAASRKAIR